MKEQRKNIIRALFLLLVFSLNTIVGFACSVGIDMGYNSKHHQHNSSDASSKCHSNKSDQKYAQETSQKHYHQHKNPGTGGDTPDDCCANDVTRFIQLDKSIVKNNLDLPAPIFLVAFTSAFIEPVLNEIILANNAGLYLLRRRCSIYDTDIRIAIQSFQI